MKARLLPVVLALVLSASVMVFPLASAAQKAKTNPDDSGCYIFPNIGFEDFHTIDLDVRSNIHTSAQEDKLHYTTTAQNIGEAEKLLSLIHI